MGNIKIAEVVVGLPVDGVFDYFIDEKFADYISVGKRVSVQFGSHRMVGYVVGLKATSTVRKLKPILSVLDNAPVLSHISLKLTKKISQYYGASWGEAIEACLPSGLRKIKKFSLPPISEDSIGSSVIGDMYQDKKRRKEGLLIQDIDGDLHWQTTFPCIVETLKNNCSVIFMVPESNMIKTTYERLLKYIENSDIHQIPIIVFDKNLSVQQELDAWARAYSTVSIIIGTRSTVFVPALNLGLIVVYDEDNFAYKQEQPPHYHCRYVAYLRSKLEKTGLFFISAVPSLEALELARKMKLKKKIFMSQKKITTKIIDMTNYNPGIVSMLSFPARNYVSSVLEKGEKVLLFMNRRGFSTQTNCSKCGHIMRCPRCGVSLIYLSSQRLMACTHCSFRTHLPKLCPECHGRYLHSSGRGIEKLEKELSSIYPEITTACIDRDTVNFNKDARLVIATQAVLKLREQMRFRLVVMINFDDELNRFDFRSSYKVFALMMRLRQMVEETFIVQTKMKQHYCIRAFCNMRLQTFYREEKRVRRELGLPPFGCLVLVRIRGEDEAKVFEYGRYIATEFTKRLGYGEDNANVKYEIYGPYAETIVKLRDKYRYVIMIKGYSPSELIRFVKDTLKTMHRKKGITLSIDLDA